jgi:hypothetical protein
MDGDGETMMAKDSDQHNGLRVGPQVEWRGDATGAGATGNIAPYPIPWLDKNLHHNQVPTPDGPPAELAHIYHFAGQIGRAIFVGQGQTSTGEVLYIGTGTDYSFLRGAYIVASGATQRGLFSHN